MDSTTSRTSTPVSAMDTEDLIADRMDRAWRLRQQRRRELHPDPRDPDYEEPPDEEAVPSRYDGSTSTRS